MSEVFTRRLRELDGEAKGRSRQGPETSSDPVLVRSAFELPSEQQGAIQNALNETFSAEIHVRFETAPDLISGIELTANGRKVAWSIADYLASLEKSVGELLKDQSKPRKAKRETPVKPNPSRSPNPEQPEPEESQ
jgi:F-type H+-transporting ATPase subunit b